MKTLKFLKIAFFLQAVFCLLCIASLLLWCIGFQRAGLLLSYFWIPNPVAPVCLVVGLVKTFRESADTQAKLLIGKKWLWFIVLFFITSVVYLGSGGFFAVLTGGV